MAGEKTTETQSYRVAGAYLSGDFCFETLRETAAFIPHCSNPVAGTAGARIEVNRDLFGEGRNLLRLGVGGSAYGNAISDKPTREVSLRVGEEIYWRTPGVGLAHASELQPTLIFSYDGVTRFGLNVQVKEGPLISFPGIAGLNLYLLNQSVPLLGSSPIQFLIGAELFFERRRSDGGGVASLIFAGLARTVPLYRIAEAAQHVSNIPGVATAGFKIPFSPRTIPNAFQEGVEVMNGLLNTLPGTIYFQHAIDRIPPRKSLGVTIPLLVSGLVLAPAGYGNDDSATFTVGNYLFTNGLAGLPRAWWPGKEDSWKRSLWRAGIAGLQLGFGAFFVSQSQTTKPVASEAEFYSTSRNPYGERGRNPGPYGFSMLGQGGALVVFELSELF